MTSRTADELTISAHTASIETINTELTTLPTKTGANTFSGINTFSNTNNSYYGSGANLTGIVSSGASLSANNTFTGNNTYTGTTTLSGGLTMNNSCMFGRSDGYTFNAKIGALYPIGYTIKYTETAASFSSGTLKTITATPVLPQGVWLITGCQVITRGTGAYTTASWTQAFLEIVAGSGTLNTSSLTFALPNNIITPLSLSLVTTIFISTSAISQISVNGATTMTVGSATRQHILYFTKIA
jgi:hypothetical protein